MSVISLNAVGKLQDNIEKIETEKERMDLKIRRTLTDPHWVRDQLIEYCNGEVAHFRERVEGVGSEFGIAEKELRKQVDFAQKLIRRYDNQLEQANNLDTKTRERLASERQETQRVLGSMRDALSAFIKRRRTAKKAVSAMQERVDRISLRLDRSTLSYDLAKLKGGAVSAVERADETIIRYIADLHEDASYIQEAFDELEHIHTSMIVDGQAALETERTAAGYIPSGEVLREEGEAVLSFLNELEPHISG